MSFKVMGIVAGRHGGNSEILAPGRDLAPYTPLENVKMLSKACKDVAV